MSTTAPKSSPVIISASAANKYLSPHNVDTNLLEQALATAVAQRNNCSIHAPLITPGMELWAEANTEIRRLFCATGEWNQVDANNRALVAHAKRDMCFTAVSGNSATGIPSLTPDFSRARGTATVDSINSRNNAGNQPSLFDTVVAPPTVNHEPPLGEWLLLYFYDEQEHELRSEFSRPAMVTQDGRIAKWDVRVLLKTVHTDFEISQPDLFQTEDDDIDFTISRATGE